MEIQLWWGNVGYALSQVFPARYCKLSLTVLLRVVQQFKWVKYPSSDLGAGLSLHEVEVDMMLLV